MSEKENIYQKLNNFRTTVGAIRKDKDNTYHKSKYADINTVIEVINPALSELGLIDIDTTKKDENGKTWLNTKLINIDNPEEYLEIETPLLLKDSNNPQALGSALTYARRYNRVTLLGLEQDDDDGNSAAGLNKNNNNYNKPNNNTKASNNGNSAAIRNRFLETITKLGLPKGDISDFSTWMNGLNYQLRNDDVKIDLLNNQNKLKGLIKDYLEAKQAIKAAG
jgi:hypothetical protein